MSDYPGDDYKLPCDVHLPPNTYIGKGCSLLTLLTALRAREAWSDEDKTFPRGDRGLPPPARPKVDVRELIAGWANHAPNAAADRTPSPTVNTTLPHQEGT